MMADAGAGVVDLSNEVYELIEAVLNGKGKVRKGTNEVTKAVERGTAKLVVVAEDVDPKAIVMHLKPLCEQKGVPYVTVKSKKELGASVGLKVNCASAAIVNEGDKRKLFSDFVAKLKSLGGSG